MLIADTEYITREVAALRASLGDVVTRDYLRSELRAFVEMLDDEDAQDDESDNTGNVSSGRDG